MSDPLPQTSLTPAEYLALERKADHKSAYVSGQIVAMSGASRRHNQITVNITGELHARLKGRLCFVFASDMRVKVPMTGTYAYPDVTALCEEPLFEDAHLDTLLNPSVLIEVLSDSTEAFDRGEKFSHYRRIPSLRDYLLIDQNKVRVEHFVRRDNQWVLTEKDGLEDTVELDSIRCSLSLREIYDKVESSS
ncbi:MAG: Uma2 family endonuclease [Thermodesulfobacteriota bacterium]